MAEIPSDMIHCMADSAWEGDKCPVVRIDRYKGNMGWGGSGGHTGHLSIGSANEVNHDDYLIKFITYANEFIQASEMGVGDAMNVILSTRNGDNDRDRMEAAKKCAAISPQLRAVIPFFRARGFDPHVDAHDYTNVWLPFFKRTDETAACLDIKDPEKIIVGSGDGYHRYFGDEHDADNLDVVLSCVIEEDTNFQGFLAEQGGVCADVAREFIRDMDIDIKFITDGVYVYDRQMIVFSDSILIYNRGYGSKNSGRTLYTDPLELCYADPAMAPGRLETILKGEVDA